MRVIAVSLLTLVVSACGSRSRSADEISPLEGRKSLPTPARTLPAASLGDAGAATESPPAFPRIVSLDAFGEGDRIADLAALRVGDRTLLAWVTYWDPNPLPVSKSPRARSSAQAPSPVTSKQGASVMVRALDQAAEPLGQ